MPQVFSSLVIPIREYLFNVHPLLQRRNPIWTRQWIRSIYCLFCFQWVSLQLTPTSILCQNLKFQVFEGDFENLLIKSHFFFLFTKHFFYQQIFISDAGEMFRCIRHMCQTQSHHVFSFVGFFCFVEKFISYENCSFILRVVD